MPWSWDYSIAATNSNSGIGTGEVPDPSAPLPVSFLHRLACPERPTALTPDSSLSYSEAALLAWPHFYSEIS